MAKMKEFVHITLDRFDNTRFEITADDEALLALENVEGVSYVYHDGAKSSAIVTVDKRYDLLEVACECEAIAAPLAYSFQGE